jgi:superkiller protein 3
VASAQTELQRALELDGKDGEARYYLGRLYFSRQNMPAALATFQKLVELDPKSVRGHNHLGQTYEGLNRFEEAEKAYQTAIALDREQPKRSEWPHYNLGLLRLSVGRAAEALTHFNEALQIQPKFAEARLKRAVALVAAGSPDQAKSELELLLAEDPANADAHYQLGRLYSKLQNPAKAKQHLLRYQELRRQ